ncbi:MAG: YbhB/YbcL family Raf kinase inhibitor-like protein [Burkholderiaceae bacterium]
MMLEKLRDPLGVRLRDRSAGLERIVFGRIKLHCAEIDVGSTAFGDCASMPRRYTADGDGLSPPLYWGELPAEASSLVLIIEYADAPTPQPAVHAIVVSLPAAEGSLQEGALPTARNAGARLKMGRNTYMQPHWIPPDPPRGLGPHRYAFQLFALSQGARFVDFPGREEVEAQVRRYAVASGCLIGTYERARPGQP